MIAPTGKREWVEPNPENYFNSEVITTRVNQIMKAFPWNGSAPFNADFHRGRRDALMKDQPVGTVAIIPSEGEKMRNPDIEYPFRQGSNLFYLTGFPEMNSAAILEKTSRDTHTFTLFVMERNPDKEQWTGLREGIDGAVKYFGADEAYLITEFEERLKTIAQVATKILFVPAFADKEINKNIQAVLEDAFRTRLQKAQEIIKQALPVPPAKSQQRWDEEIIKRVNTVARVEDYNAVETLIAMRTIKTHWEVAMIQRACDITGAGLIKAMRKGKLTQEKLQTYAKFENGRNMGEIRAALEGEMRKLGAIRQSFPSIVAPGAHGTILHNPQAIEYGKPGDMVLIDCGAEYGPKTPGNSGLCPAGYAGDVTRTFPLDGKFTEDQKAIYSIVLLANQTCIERVKPGVTIGELHNLSAKIVIGGLIGLGIMKGNLQEILQEKSYKKFYPHSVGHHMGLDVHDRAERETIVSFEQYMELRRKEPIRPGMVFTIEPGIYIKPGDETVDQRWWGLAVRIEDNILVTDDGHINLTKEIPKTIQEIEDTMAY